jgi:DNA processing protein
MPTRDQITLLALCRISDLNWYLIAREAMRPNGLEHLLEARFTEGPATAEAGRLLLDARPRLKALRDEVKRMVTPLLGSGARLTTVLDKDYPLNLREIFNRPPFLFYRGELREDDTRSVAVVGTREPTEDGIKRARKMARMLAEQKVTVLSGLARGIDTTAHRATLAARGRTIAVLGSGLNRIYPPENAELAKEICRRGAVVSQFWPDMPPRQSNFPRRNITMSGLGQGTVVIEASATSGAKMQARLALQHGKKVFLLESLVDSHQWARKYLKRGAIMVSRTEDILKLLRPPEEIRSRTEQTYQFSLALR